MRKFLKDIHICGAISVWREGKVMKYAIDNLLKYCDSVCICMDYPDQTTLDIVDYYANKNAGIVSVGTTVNDIPALRNPNHIKRRAKVYGSEIVEQKLALVKKVHKERPIDILLTPDSDEVFNDKLPELLEWFWESKATCVFVKPIEVFDTEYIVSEKGMHSHARIYKYRSDINFTPRRYFDFYRPYRGRDAFKVKYYFTHLSQLRMNWELRKEIGDKDLVEAHPNTKLFKLDKPAWEVVPEEYDKLLKSDDFVLLKDYEKGV